jgi:hypothetical protein
MIQQRAPVARLAEEGRHAMQRFRHGTASDKDLNVLIGPGLVARVMASGGFRAAKTVLPAAPEHPMQSKADFVAC